MWPSPPICRLVPALLLLACQGTESAGTQPEVQRLEEGLRVSRNGEGHLILHLEGSPEAAGEPVTVARLDGVDLHLDDGEGRRRLPMVDRTPIPGGWEFACAPTEDHAVRLQVVGERDGSWRIEVVDRIRLRSPLVELSLCYGVAGSGEPAETWLPHRQEGEQLAGDASFRSPLAWFRRGERALALRPDLELLSQERRVPQFLEVEPGARGIRHGLAALEVRPSAEGGLRYQREGMEPVDLRGTTIRFAHRVRVRGSAGENSLRTEFARLWQETPRPRPQAAEGWDRTVRRAIDEALAAAWRRVQFGELQGGLLSVAVDGVHARFDTRHQSLRTATAIVEDSRARSLTARRTQMRELLDLLLVAPRRSGLLPIEYRSGGAADGKWSFVEEGRYDAPDAASTAYWMLRLADSLPERRQAVLDTCAQLARFLVQNQRPSGMIPTTYEEPYLSPARDGAPPEQATLCLFLAAYGAERGAEDALQASRGLLTILEAASGLDDQVLPLAHAALAALYLVRSEIMDGSRASAWLDRLARHQQLWSPQWIPGDHTGGFGDGHLGSTWSTPVQAVAAEALLEGYELLGEREWLERGAAALRATLAQDDGGWARDGTLPSSTDWGLAACAGVLGSLRQRLGAGIVDVEGGFAQSLESAWFEALEIGQNTIQFQLLTRAEMQSGCRVRFHNFGPQLGPWRIVANGRVIGTFENEELEAGVSISPELLPTIRYAPPAQWSAGGLRPPRAVLRGSLAPDSRAWLELSTDLGLLEEIPMTPSADGRFLVAEYPPTLTGLDLGTEVSSRVGYTHEGQNYWSPERGQRRVRIADSECIDPGDDDESALVEDRGSRIVPFVNGTENARLISERGHVTYLLPIPPGATRVEIDLTTDGSLRVLLDEHLLHEDRPGLRGSRQVRLQLADRRRWSDGVVPIRIEPISAPAALARIEYRPYGDARAIDLAGEQVRLRRPDARIRTLVIPATLADRPSSIRPDNIQQAILGGPSYRSTPAPESRLTSGSVDTLLQRLSGGMSRLQARVLDPAVVNRSYDELREDPDAVGRAIADELTEAAGVSLSDFDAVFLIHSGMQVREPTAIDADRRLFLIGERRADGSLFAGGDVLASLIRTRYDLIDLDRPETGNFGALAFLGKGAGHVPSDGIGLNMLRSGWADLLRVQPKAEPQLLRIDGLSTSRVVFSLPASMLLDRGDLLLESHSLATGLPELPPEGCLLYWDYGNAGPDVLRNPDQRARLRLQRLSPTTPLLQTPFTPASATDLFRTAARLDGTSVPPLATHRGEAPWMLEDLFVSDTGTVEVRARFTGDDLLDGNLDTWATSRFGRLTPLIVDSGQRGLGSVRRRGASRALTLRHAQGSGLQGRFPLAADAAARRLFVRLSKSGGGATRVLVRLGTRTILKAEMPAGAHVLNGEADLLSTFESSNLELGVETVDSEVQLRLEQLLVVPLGSSVPIRPSGIGVRDSLLMDDTVYSRSDLLEVGADGSVEVVMPVLLPDSAATLRVVAGLPGDSPAGSTCTIDATLRGAGLRGESLVIPETGVERLRDRTPLYVGMFAVPAGTGEVSFLTFRVRGEPGTKLHLVDLAVQRSGR